MYIDISNVAQTIVDLFDRNALQINNYINLYQRDKRLNVLLGIRNVLSNNQYPSLEIEPSDGTPEWFSTRTQMGTYNLKMILTTSANDVVGHIKFHTGLAKIVTSLLTSPENLQLMVVNETRWNPNGGLVAVYITDSFITNASFSTFKEGTIRVTEFDWFGKILEPYPDIKFRLGESNQPTILMPANG